MKRKIILALMTICILSFVSCGKHPRVNAVRAGITEQKKTGSPDLVCL